MSIFRREYNDLIESSRDEEQTKLAEARYESDPYCYIVNDERYLCVEENEHQLREQQQRDQLRKERAERRREEQERQIRRKDRRDRRSGLTGMNIYV